MLERLSFYACSKRCAPCVWASDLSWFHEKHARTNDNRGEIDEIHWKIDKRLGNRMKTIEKSKAKTKAKAENQKPKAKPPAKKKKNE